MVYVVLNALLLVFLIYFSRYCDKKIKSDAFEVGNFAISLLFACIESAIFLLTLVFRKVWADAFITQAMKLVFMFDALFFISISFSFIQLGQRKKHTTLNNFVKILMFVFAIFLVYFKFKGITVEVDHGIVVQSEYLFIKSVRTFFPWTWNTVYMYSFRYIFPAIAYILLVLMQEYKANQLARYQTTLAGGGLAIMWISNWLIQIIGRVSPDFTFLYMYSYLLMITVMFTAWTKANVPSGRGFWVSVLKLVVCYALPAAIIGAYAYFFQPKGNIFLNVLFVAFFAVISAVLIIYSIWINEKLSASRKIYTADYAQSLEKDLASIDYSDAEMDAITNKMHEILRRNLETSSMNVYILSGTGEVSTAYSSNNLNQKVRIDSPMFETLLNVNRSVVVYSQIEKDHAYADIQKELEEFMDYAKCDVLFVLNEGHNILGLITLGKKINGDHYKEYDYNVFEKLYSYFFVFGYFMRNISNKDVLSVVNRELRMSSQIITSIQENVDKIENDKVDVGYVMVPAHNIGGEFIDLIRLTDTRHLFVIGDLSGQGIAGSMNMVILKSVIRTFLAETHDFKELVVKINSFIRDGLRKGTIFAGLFALVDFETDTMYYINCGVPALFLYTQVYNNVIEIQGSGHILGFVKDLTPYVSVKTTKFNQGDIILTCTDGLIQSHSLRGEVFGKERVQQAILDNSTYPAQRMAQFTFDNLKKFMSKEMEDDVSILVLKYGKAKKAEEEEETSAEENAVTENPVAEETSENQENPEVPESEIAENSNVEAKSEPVTEVEQTPVSENISSEPEFSVETETFEEIADEVTAVAEENSPEEEPVAEKKEESKVEIHHDAAPEGFDMSELADLDDLLKDAGL